MHPGGINATSTPSAGDAVLVSLSSINLPGQRAVLQRAIDAVAELGLPLIVTTGPAMSADDTSSSRALADHYARQNLEAPASLDHFWMPFTANRQFKQAYGVTPGAYRQACAGQ